MDSLRICALSRLLSLAVDVLVPLVKRLVHQENFKLIPNYARISVTLKGAFVLPVHGWTSSITQTVPAVILQQLPYSQTSKWTG
jgi:hypothetical protein